MWLHGRVSNVFPEPTKPATGVETLLTRRLATWGPVLALPVRGHVPLREPLNSTPLSLAGKIKEPRQTTRAPVLMCDVLYH